MGPTLPATPSAPTITIVTICRNAIEPLRPTVESVLVQLTDDIEYLIVDGASDDGTQVFLEAMSSRGLHWISEPDSGISDAMNKGLRQAEGTWVMHLHAGDTLLPGAIDAFKRCISANPHTDVICGAIVKDEPNGDIVCFARPDRLRLDMTIPHPATIARASLLRNLGGFDVALKNAMDYDLFLRALAQGATFVSIDRPITRFSSGGQSEKSVWNTLVETHEIRRRVLSHGVTKSRVYLLALFAKTKTRSFLQRIHADWLVDRYRSRLAIQRKELFR
jgi:putative colanic acid biosynthesis glycosyltransferase